MWYRLMNWMSEQPRVLGSGLILFSSVILIMIILSVVLSIFENCTMIAGLEFGDSGSCNNEQR